MTLLSRGLLVGVLILTVGACARPALQNSVSPAVGGNGVLPDLSGDSADGSMIATAVDLRVSPPSGMAQLLPADLGQLSSPDLALSMQPDLSTASSCAHPICSTGSKLTASCDACATKICAKDSYCCSTTWNSICVGEVSSVCGQSCP
jgi:hypothetical protein